MSVQDIVSQPCPIQVQALGAFRVCVEGVPLAFGRSAPRKPLLLLKLLIAAGPRPASRQWLCDALWPDADGFDAYRALITTVYRLRRLLLSAQAVSFTDSHLALCSELCEVDAWTFERACASGSGAARRRLLDLYAGPLFGDDDDANLFEARDRLQRRFVRLVLALGREAETGEPDVAIDLYERALDTGVPSEEIHQALMRCLVRVDRPAAAIAIYRRCREVLRQRLGAAPSSSTELLLRSLRAHASGVAA